MALSGILSAAVSGLANASSRVAVSADNIVNANTAGYQAKEIRSSTIVTRQAAGTRYASGGVSGVVRTRTDPTLANGANGANGSNVDIASEFVNIIQADVSYRASLRVIETADTLTRDLIDIKA